MWACVYLSKHSALVGNTALMVSTNCSVFMELTLSDCECSMRTGYLLCPKTSLEHDELCSEVSLDEV